MWLGAHGVGARRRAGITWTASHMLSSARHPGQHQRAKAVNGEIRVDHNVAVLGTDDERARDAGQLAKEHDDRDAVSGVAGSAPGRIIIGNHVISLRCSKVGWPAGPDAGCST